MKNGNEKKHVRYRVLPVLIITLILVSVIIGVAVNSTRQMTQEMLVFYQKEQRVSLMQQSARLCENLTAIIKDLEILSSLSEFIVDDEIKSRKHLAEFYQRHNPFVVAGYRMDQHGILRYVEGGDRSGEGADINHQEHVKRLFQNRKTIVSGSFKAVEGYHAIAVHTPVFDGELLKGSLATLVKWDAFGLLFNKIKVSPESLILLLDPHQKIIYHPDEAYTGKLISEAPQILKDGLKLVPGYFYQHQVDILEGAFFGDRSYAVACEPFEVRGSIYSLVSCSPYDDILGPVMQVSKLNVRLAVLFLSIIAAGLIYYFYLFHTDKQNWFSYQKKLKQEIIERRNSEKALRESRETLLTVLDSVDATIYVSDLSSYEILFMNKNMIEHFGSDFTGDVCHKAFRNRLSPCHFCSNPYLIDDKNEPTGLKVWDDYNPVAKRWYINFDRAIKWIDGRYVRIQIATDITQYKKLEDEHRKIGEKLEQAHKMEALGTLAGGVAHDLNNILSGIVTYPEMLLMELPEHDPMREALLTINRSGQKAAEIVQDMLALTRRGIVVRKITNLNRIISEYFKSPEFRKMISDHEGIAIKENLAADLKNIKASDAHIRKAVMNLILNAAEAQPQGGEVIISTSNVYLEQPPQGYDKVNEGLYVALTVSDQGVGINEEDRNKIFEPFYTRKVMGNSGTGLGMTVVWGVVEDHKGYITVNSQKGQGTDFILYFPITRESLEKEKETLPVSVLMGNREKILVVDDVKEQRDIAAALLEKLNYTVATVESGEKALAYLALNSVDLIILDMIMEPGIDGLETYQKILESAPCQKALVASGFSETDRVRKLKRLGVQKYVQKPYSLEALGVAIKETLGEIGTFNG